MICSVGKQNGSGHQGGGGGGFRTILTNTAFCGDLPPHGGFPHTPTLLYFPTPSECWESVHKRGVRACHRWEGFRVGSPACVACSRSPAERKCNTCNDLLCLACFNERWARSSNDRGNLAFVVSSNGSVIWGLGAGRQERQIRVGA